MNELNEVNQAKNTLIKAFAESLNTSLVKYNKMISNGNSGGALNTLKNIEVLIRIIEDIQGSKALKDVLDSSDIIWGQIDNQDEISKIDARKKFLNECNILNKKLTTYCKIEDVCKKENLYYSESLVDSVLKNQSNDKNPISCYKRLLNMKQFENKTYQNTINERGI